VRSPDQAAAIARVADGVVVGSAIVSALAAAGGDPAAGAALVATLAKAVRNARIGVAA
jgi:tryptophan synthase alpha chain